jgi:hypothetical protein
MNARNYTALKKKNFECVWGEGEALIYAAIKIFVITFQIQIYTRVRETANPAVPRTWLTSTEQ